MATQELHIGVVGAGGFARFAVAAFLRVPGVRVVTVTDIDPEAAKSMADAFQLTVCHSLGDLLAHPTVQLVYIATPPYLHFTQSRVSLLAGKHVICEKPAALEVGEAEALAELARNNHLLYTVNLMQRYNPLAGIVKTIVDHRLLGDFRHGYFENYASDEFLAPRHWFWDPAKSGGIFIEHGVHFFDLFSGWLGNGIVVSSLQLTRAATQPAIVDRVQATVLYKSGTVNFYHGFDQRKIMDRQEMRLLFQRGELTLFEWVPVRMKLHGLVSEKDLKSLEALTGASPTRMDATPDNPERPDNPDNPANPAGLRPITLEYANPAGKQGVYQQLLTSMLADQWAWIRDRMHVRVIDDRNAVESLRMAATATSKAQHFREKE